MYTNINTEHSIDVFHAWFLLHSNKLPEDFPQRLVLDGLKYLMKHNVFSFGNQFFLQLNGTAMGTNVACMYATMNAGLHARTHARK